MMGTTEQVLDLEQKMLDRVQNRGGRAACQDDARTFFIMRGSQLRAWTEEMRQSYREDLRAAAAAGRNLMSEKYAYLMERTSPSEFAALRALLPPRTPAKQSRIDAICAAHLGWLEELTEEFPWLAGRGRPIHRTADSAVCTSFETYLWGELATYSLRTLTLYDARVRQLQDAGENMNRTILLYTVRQYGYGSLEQAEAGLAGS